MSRFIGQYEVLKELGAGQYGTVYLAAGEVPARGRRPARDRLVALKKLRNTADAESVQQLVQEFSLLDQVKHRGIVGVYDYIEAEHAVAMEYIHGATLRTVLEELDRAREQVFTEAAVEIGCEIADALYQAYTTPGDNGEPLQLVHRDLKPANIMLTKAGELKILDWGLARVDNKEFGRSDPDRIKGSLLYMSPEQARGDAVDHRADVFSLGLILFELLMREPLYRVDDRARDPLSVVMKAIETGDTSARCAELEKRLPAVGPVITRALRPRPADRYPTAQDMMVDLRRTLHRERGADLKEFCDFFFGTIHTIGEPPRLEDMKRRGGGAGGRMSIEERLRQSMARDRMAAAPAPPAPAGAPMAQDPPRGGGPVRPPVGGGASRSTPFAPPPPASRPALGAAAPPPKPRPKPIGQRSPDETGMLEMVPLSDDGDEVEIKGDPSATAFFAIPAPKAERARAAAPPPPPGGPPPAIGGGPPPPPTPGAYGGPPPPPPRPPMGSGPMGAPPMMAPPMGGGSMGVSGAPPPPSAIRGPIAGPVAGGGAASPFQVAGPPPPPVGDNAQRTQSQRVYAFLISAVALVCLVALAAFYLRPGTTEEKPAGTVAAAPAPSAEPAPRKKAEPKGDTGGAAPAKAEKPAKKRSSGASSSSGQASAAPAKPPPAAKGPGPLKVTLKTPGAATSVEVTCSTGFRQKASFSGDVAVVQNVPLDGCTLFFKGGPPARWQGVKGGTSLACTITPDAQARCN